MRLSVPVVSVALAAVIVGIYDRAEIKQLLGFHDDLPQLVFDFDRPVDQATIDRTARLLEGRLLAYGAGIRIDGQRILVDAPPSQILDIQTAVDPAANPVAGLTLWLVDYVPDYFARLRPQLRDTSARVLDITTGVDAIGEYLAIPGDRKYVNPAWAERHHCDTRDRIEGTGVSCTVTAAQRLAALLHGDPDLFITPIPAPLAPPPDRELLLDVQGATGHAYVVERPPIELAPAMFASITADGANATVVLTPAGTAAVAARASAGTVELVVASGERLVPVKLVRAADAPWQLVVPIDKTRREAMVYAFAIHALHALMRVGD